MGYMIYMRRSLVRLRAGLMLLWSGLTKAWREAKPWEAQEYNVS